MPAPGHVLCNIHNNIPHSVCKTHFWGKCCQRTPTEVGTAHKAVHAGSFMHTGVLCRGHKPAQGSRDNILRLARSGPTEAGSDAMYQRHVQASRYLEAGQPEL